MNARSGGPATKREPSLEECVSELPSPNRVPQGRLKMPQDEILGYFQL
jgi:hypothetical protein